MSMSPRRRARVARGVQYAVLVVALLLLALLADWGEIKRAFFDVTVAKSLFPRVLTVALKNTLVYTAAGFAFGLGLGLVLALMKLSTVGPYRWIATLYIEIFRGLPALLVFVAFGFGVPVAFGTVFPIITTVMLALGLVGAAYIAETIRAGIQAVPRGQVEAARSLGMSAMWTTYSIVVPQAFRIVLPPLTNELILLTKDSSLIYVLGLTLSEFDLTFYGRDVLNQSKSMTAIVVAGACYLIITVPLSFLVRRLEAKQAVAR
jgi:polar amino acid transport system permease protein